MEVSICCVQEMTFVSTSKLGNISKLRNHIMLLACSMEYVRIPPYSKSRPKMDVSRIYISFFALRIQHVGIRRPFSP